MRPFLRPLVLLSAGLSGCAGGPSFQADPALLVPWTAAGQERLPAPPYAARYVRDGRSLTFVASLHEHRSGCDTFRVVEREFERLDPQVVILEGFSSADGVSPAGYSKWVRGQAEGELWPGGEAAFAAKLALDAGVPFLGGEPSAELVFREAQSERIGPEDLIYFFVVRQVPQWKRAEEDRDRTFEQLYREMIRQLAHMHPIEAEAFQDPKGFLAWYQRRNGRAFVYDEITTEQSAPLTGEDALFTQRVSTQVGEVRDAHIASVIADQLNQHERVLVVYGAGHHLVQEPVLAKLLGPPESWSRLDDPPDDPPDDPEP